MAAKVSKKTTKKKTVKKKRVHTAQRRGDVSEAKIRATLTLYYAVGGIKKCAKEMHVGSDSIPLWIKENPKWVAEAKEAARDIRLNEAVGIINKLEFRINTKLDSKNNKIPFKELLVGYGIFADKYMKLAGIAEKQAGTVVNLNLTETIVLKLHEIEKAERLKTFNNGKNRIKEEFRNN